MKKDKIIITIIGFVLIIAVVVLAILLVTSNSTKKTSGDDGPQACLDKGGSYLASKPPRCLVDEEGSSADGYVGLTEQAALDKAKADSKAARVVERDGESLAVTMDFSPGRLNLYVKDGRVYKVVIEGEGAQ